MTGLEQVLVRGSMWGIAGALIAVLLTAAIVSVCGQLNHTRSIASGFRRVDDEQSLAGDQEQSLVSTITNCEHDKHAFENGELK